MPEILTQIHGNEIGLDSDRSLVLRSPVVRSRAGARVQFPDGVRGSVLGPNFTEDRFYVLAHRGSGALYPENSYEAFRNSMADGNVYLEMDIQELSDGVNAVLHNTTVDYSTTGTGNLSAIDTATWEALSMDTDTWFRGGYGDLTPPLFTKVLREHKDRAAFCIEIKDTGTNFIRDLRREGIARDQVLIQSFLAAPLDAAVLAGYQTVALGTGFSASASVAAGYTWAGIPSDAALSEITSRVDAGLKVLIYTPTRRWQRDYFKSLGCYGIFADDPSYVLSDLPAGTRDEYSRQTYISGMLSPTEQKVKTDANVGTFSAPNYWGWADAPANTTFILQGWACPIKGREEPESFQIDFQFTHDSVLSGDETRWGAVFLASPEGRDRAYTDDTTYTWGGYNLLMRKNGLLQIYLRAPVTGTSTLLAQASLAAIADGEENSYRIIVTRQTITFQRYDAAGTTFIGSVSVSDTSARRGGYFFFGRASLAGKWRNVVIS